MPGEFVVNVAADLYGCKENIAVRFEARPTVVQLKDKAEGLLQTEANVQRPPGANLQHVRVRKMHYWNDYEGAWRALLTCDQLTHQGQVYAFQEESADPSGQLPLASPPRTRISVPAASPTRYRGATRPGSPLKELKDKVAASPQRSAMRSPEGGAVAEMDRYSPGSLLADVRVHEQEKKGMDIDAHRAAERRQTMDFLTGAAYASPGSPRGTFRVYSHEARPVKPPLEQFETPTTVLTPGSHAGLPAPEF
eukprot:TRINITY_DN9301_c0_g5_i1.p2 TRINITY_DN9301_c0_g5~~TRINITY_DN9301_c0_g5_i1.p2  ORF type:complete len:251 (+),score=95.94 TRINITY_DN9301_c0_g5_i1:150-902(+)